MLRLWCHSHSTVTLATFIVNWYAFFHPQVVAPLTLSPSPSILVLGTHTRPSVKADPKTRFHIDNSSGSKKPLKPLAHQRAYQLRPVS